MTGDGGQHAAIEDAGVDVPRRRSQSVAARDVILPERIDTDRLVLRGWVADDAPALAATIARNIDHLRPWMPWIAREPLLAHERRAMIDGWRQARLDGGDSVLGVFFEGAVIGGCGLHRRRGPHGLEIGYWISRDCTGRGFATEAAAALTTAALAVPGISFVEIHHDRANVASRRIPERLGYRFVEDVVREAVAPAETGIESTWRMESTAWMAPTT